MKGSIDFAAVAIFSMLLVGSIFGTVMDFQGLVRDTFRQETTHIVAERIGGDIIALDSYRRGQLEIDLKGDEYNYSIIEYKGQKAYSVYGVNISYNNQNPRKANFTLPENMMVRAKGTTKEGRYFCIHKTGRVIEIGRGTC